MFDPWILIGLAAIIILGVAGGTCIAIRGHECRERENTAKREEYCRLLSAITRVHLAGDDEEALAGARLALADHVNRMNVIAGYEVLVNLNALLELQNRSAGGRRDPGKEYAVLQRLVVSMRLDTGRKDMKKCLQEGFSFKFYLPVPRSDEEAEGDRERREKTL